MTYVRRRTGDLHHSCRATATDHFVTAECAREIAINGHPAHPNDDGNDIDKRRPRGDASGTVIPPSYVWHMQITHTRFACEWCGIEFGRRSLFGRRPLYCTQTCRQRAYEERRRGASYGGLPKP